MQWAGIVLVNHRGEMLLNLRAKADARWPGQWDIIGGRVEDGEDTDQRVAREILDEADSRIGLAGSFIDNSRGSGGAAHARGDWGVSPQVLFSQKLSGAARQGCAAAGHRYHWSHVLMRGIETVLDEFLASPQYRALAS